MKSELAVLVIVARTLSVWAQVTPPPGTISRPPNWNTGSVAPTPRNGDLGLGTLTFTNASGASYTVEQLAGQLQRLRSVVDEVLPSLAAFIETYSNSVPAGQRGLTGTISGILSGILNRNTNSSAGTTQGGTNLLSALRGLLTTNAPAASIPSAATQNTYAEILNLQNELQPIPSILQKLNVTGTAGTQYASPPAAGNQNLTPTGR